MTSIPTIATTTIKLVINPPKYYHQFRHIQSILLRISFPYIFIVACVGLITNTATIGLLSKSFVTQNTKHKWTLIALALSDLVYNSALLIRVIHDITSGKIEHLCIIISFLSHLAELLSACFTVLFTIQRYAAVRYPLKAVVYKRSSPVVIILLIFFSSLIFCIALSHTNVYIDCHEELKLSWFIADALSSFIIPFSLILIFNICIVSLIRRHARSSIIKQSILLRPQKRIKNSRNHENNKTNRHEDSHSTIYSCGNPLVLQGTMPETDIDNKFNFNSSPIQTNKTNKQKLACNLSNEYQASEISISMSPMEKISSDAFSTASSRHSMRSQNGSKKKCHSRRTSHQSNDTDLISNKDSQTAQSIRVTRMLVLVSTCFLILNAPAHLCVIALKLYTGIGMELQVFSEHAELEHFKQTKNLTNNQLKHFVFIQTNNKTMIKHEQLLSHDIEIIDDQILIHLFYIAILITQLISYSSYSINFFLYSYSGITFRTSLRQFLTKLRRR